MRGNCFFLTVFLAVLFTRSASAETYVVRPDGSGDFPTIQTAIDACTDGDVIELTDGTFLGDGNRDIDYLGTAITVRSQSGDPETCVIDCEGSESEPHRGFYFDSSDGPDAVLQAVTIGNGYATAGGGLYCVYAAAPTISNCTVTGCTATSIGGGVYCRNGASPTISDCDISNNTAVDGGAIACVSGSSPTITTCSIGGNSAVEGGGGIYAENNSDPMMTGNAIIENTANFGGGVYCVSASPTITDNTIIGNFAGDDGGDGGGGIFCAYCPNPTIDNNVIRENFAYSGGGINCFDSAPTVSNNMISENLAFDGGAINYCCSSSGMISSNIIVGNEAYDLGGGIYCNSGTDVGISNNIICDNTTSGAFSYGGAICCNESNPLITYNTICRNSAVHGGGISCRAYSDAPIMNNTIFGNSANYGGGIHCDLYSNPTLESCIIAFSTQGQAAFCSDENAIPALICCDLYGNAGGDWVDCIADQFGINGNISEDPLFCNPENDDFTIRSDSPCAPENNPECGLIGALPVGCEEPTAVEMTTWGRIKAQNR